jgi:DNA polymerase-3 subunit delta'
MSNKTLPWHETQWQRFFSLLQNNKLPHALLLSGGIGLGKRQFAQQAAQVLFCQQHTACGTCANCQLFLSGNHPDFYQLQISDENKSIKIDMVRSLAEHVVQTATQGGDKVILISSADEFQFAAANALLKLLEEPPSNTFFILVSDNPSSLLPTIRSRCQELRFTPSYSLSTQEWLQKQGGAVELLKFTEGAPFLALQYAQDETLQKDYQTFTQSWDAFWQTRDIFGTAAIWSKLSVNDVLTWAQQNCKRMGHDSQFAVMLNCYEQLIALSRLLQRQPNLNLQLQYEAFLSQIIPSE